LLDREHLEFNKENASLTLRKEPMSEINLEANDGAERTFTRKALERLGFRVTDNKNMIPAVIIKHSDNRTVWILQKKSGTVEFYCIYDLSLHLRSFSN
jgi:hypothetical protein